MPSKITSGIKIASLAPILAEIRGRKYQFYATNVKRSMMIRGQRFNFTRPTLLITRGQQKTRGLKCDHMQLVWGSRGVRGSSPQKILKIGGLQTPFLAFWPISFPHLYAGRLAPMILRGRKNLYAAWKFFTRLKHWPHRPYFPPWVWCLSLRLDAYGSAEPLF